MAHISKPGDGGYGYGVKSCPGNFMGVGCAHRATSDRLASARAAMQQIAETVRSFIALRGELDSQGTNSTRRTPLTQINTR